MYNKSKSKKNILAKYLLFFAMLFGSLLYTSCIDSKTNKDLDIPLIVNQIKEQIAVQGNVSDNEDRSLKLLHKVMKGKEFDPKLVEEVHGLVAKTNKSDLEKKVSNLLDAIQIKGNISVSDENAINNLLALTVDKS